MLQNKPVDILDEEYEIPTNVIELSDDIDNTFDIYNSLTNPEKKITLRKKLNQLVDKYNGKRGEKIFKHAT